MKVKVNGEKKEVFGPLTLKELLEKFNPGSRRKVVVLNRKLVMESEWDSKMIQENDEVEILNMVGGG